MLHSIDVYSVYGHIDCLRVCVRIYMAELLGYGFRFVGSCVIYIINYLVPFLVIFFSYHERIDSVRPRADHKPPWRFDQCNKARF